MTLTREHKSALFVLLIVTVIALVGAKIWLSLRVDPVEENLKNDQVVKVLFVVHDADRNALLSDVFVYYPDTRRGAIFDISGNTGAIWKSLGRVDRIDAIYHEKGIVDYCGEIAALTGLDIPFTVEISEESFSLLTDFFGGLKLFISTPVDAVSKKGTRVLLPSGAVNLDGDKIKDFLEYGGVGEDDYQNERRQSAFTSFLAAMQEKRNRMLDKKDFHFFSSCMKVNVDEKDVRKLLSVISNLDATSLTVQSIIGSSRFVDGKILLFPYQGGQLMKDVVKQKIRMLINQDPNTNHRVYVLEILNGTYKQGLARNASILLENAGYNILQVGNGDRMDYEHTVIIDHIGNSEAAAALGDFITCYNIITDSEGLSSDDDSGNVDFTLILGNDWDGRYVRGGFGKENSESD